MISKGWGGPVRPYGRTATPRRSRLLEGPSPLTRRQVRHPHQVVGRSHKVPSQPRPLYSPDTGSSATLPPSSSTRTPPPPFADLLAHPVSRMPRGASVYRRVCPPGHVRRDSTIAHGSDTLPGVVPFISSQGLGTVPPLPGIVQHHGHSLTLRPTRGPAHYEVHQQPVAVLPSARGP